MKEQDILQQLKKLAHIKPDPHYARRSFYAIIDSKHIAPAAPFFRTILMRVAFATTAIAILAVVTIKSEAPLQIAGLDTKGLEAEASELDQSLRLANISYNTSSQPANIALKEAAGTEPGHLNTLVIQKENPVAAEPMEYSNPDIDRALNALTE